MFVRIAKGGVGKETNTVPGVAEHEAPTWTEVDRIVGIGEGVREERVSPMANRAMSLMRLHTQLDGRFDKEQSASGSTKQPPQW